LQSKQEIVALIEVTNLYKKYGQNVALKGLTFSVPKGRIVGFLGSNGAGKTTTMDIICGCIGPTSGSVKIGGVDTLDDPIATKAKIGYLPDEPPLYTDMRVIEYVEFAGKLRGLYGDALRQRVNETMNSLSIEDVSGRLVGNLSKGYRQRVGLAQALIHNPDVLVLDEPTEGLDPTQIIQIRDLIKSLAGKHTILLSSHILSEVQNTCDEIIIINKGEIVHQGTYSQITGSQGEEEAYRIVVRQGASALKDRIQGIQGVSQVEAIDDVTLDVSVSQSGVSDEILDQILQGKHGLVKFAPNTRSLEDIFIQLTHSS
jgi:ABC-2 type transport system ATP-binding protein